MAFLGFHPLRYARGRVRRWMEARLPRSDTQELTQRNVYILPTRAGWVLLLTLVILLIAAINYQINLGYLLTFMLAGAAAIGMYSCHNNLRGVHLHLHPPAAVFAGQAAPLKIDLSQKGKRPRYGIGMALLDSEDWAWLDVPAQGSASVQLAWPASQRGWHACPTLSAQTHYPLGHFRVWTVWCPASQILVYPQAESACPPLPVGVPTAGAQANMSSHAASGEFDGVRPYRRGDALKTIVWKKMAKGGELVSRDSQQLHSTQLWLDYQQTGGAQGKEARLSRLTAWVLAAHQQELCYGLRLPHAEISPDSGAAQRDRCLQALALA